MDHKHIDEFDIVERYLTGKLAAGETTEFEEHFVGCLQCVDRLETTKAFIEGLRLVAIEREPASVSSIPIGLPWNLRYTTSRKAFAVAACVLLLVVVAGAVLVFTQIRRFRFEADQARSASAQWERRFEEERQLSATMASARQESERELTEQVARLRAELENKREQEPAKSAQVNVPILELSSTRGSERSPGSTNKISLPRSSTSFFLSLPLEGEGGYKSYRMSILDNQKQVIWQGGGVKANAYNSLGVIFDTHLFRSGQYLLTVDGVAGDGSISVVGKYSFRVRKTP
jgi:hypothetical protein